MTIRRPRPFRDFPLQFGLAVKFLRRFRVIGVLLETECRSLRDVAKVLSDREDGCCIGTICKLQSESALVALFRESFGGKIELYANGKDGMGVGGLSEDGRMALQLTIEALDELDRKRSI